MGMYGMVLVTRPDQTLFEGGPAYAVDVPLLFSDLEVATNLDPVGSFPFHDIRPDVFMVNGVSGSQLEAADRIVHYEPGQPVALRLGSMAYSRMELIFPAELNATCFMSDGRPVPSPFSVETLNIYPGERFTVLIEPDANWDGHITCNYWSMVDETLEGSNGLHVRDAALHISETEKMAIKGWPNPAHSHIQWSDGSTLSVWDTFGRLVCVTDLQNGILTVDGWEPGTYIARFEDGRTARFVVSE
jgi:FtsP/CotA-like multicopper oxidase with cupredoxin domain